jgi:hypothetical protein
MADKQVDGLDPKLSPIGADEVPVFDSAEAGPEKLKRVSYRMRIHQQDRDW